MRSHLPSDPQPDPAITQAIAAIWPAVGLLSMMLADERADLRDPARRLAMQMHGRDLIRAARALQDLGVRTAR